MYLKSHLWCWKWWIILLPSSLTSSCAMLPLGQNASRSSPLLTIPLALKTSPNQVCAHRIHHLEIPSPWLISFSNDCRPVLPKPLFSHSTVYFIAPIKISNHISRYLLWICIFFYQCFMEVSYVSCAHPCALKTNAKFGRYAYWMPRSMNKEISDSYGDPFFCCICSLGLLIPFLRGILYLSHSYIFEVSIPPSQMNFSITFHLLFKIKEMK